VRVRAAVISAGLVLVLACTSSSVAPAPSPSAPSYQPEPAAHRGGTAIIGEWEAPATLTPFRATTAAELRLGRLLFSPLWGFYPNLQPYPDLVREIPTAANGGVKVKGAGMTLDVKLRPGLRWSDGQPLTADDVIFTVDAARAGEIAMPALTRIVSQERRSATDVRWRFAAVDAGYLLIGSDFTVLPRHRLASIPASEWRDLDYFRHPDVGSGPFKYEGEISGQEIVFRANPEYSEGRRDGPFGHPAYLDSIIERLYTGKAAEIAALSLGEADLGLHLAPSDEAQLADLRGLDTLTGTTLDGEFLLVNHAANAADGRSPPWTGDATALEALATAIDRASLSRVAFGDAAAPTAGLFPGPMADWNRGLKAGLPDAGNAAKQLDGAGWQRGVDGIRAKGDRRLEFSLLIPCDDATRRLEADELIREWAAVGARATMQCRPAHDLFASDGVLANGAFDAALIANAWPPDPSAWADFGAVGGGRNWGRCSSHGVDVQFAAGAATLDSRKRRAAYLAAAREWLAHHCTIPLLDRPQVVQRAGRLHNIRLHPMPGYETWNAADWWLSSAS
jgi:peptide/nickel transport system substrate-binding protein